jgi:hypothetical protein
VAVSEEADQAREFPQAKESPTLASTRTVRFTGRRHQSLQRDRSPTQSIATQQPPVPTAKFFWKIALSQEDDTPLANKIEKE